MKKFAALFLALSLSAALVGCGSTEKETEKQTEKQTEAATTEAATTEEATEAATTEAATEEATEAATTEAATEEVVEVMTHEEFVAAELDTKVVVETYVQDKQSWWDNTVTVYAQSEDGAYFIYNMACTEEEDKLLEVGTKIKVTGYKAEWSGEVEIVDATFEILEGEYIAEATDVTALLGKDELIEKQNQFVSFKGMTVEESEGGVPFLYKWDGSGQEGDDIYFNVSIDGQTYNFTIESYLTDSSTDVYKAAQGLKVGDVIDMEGFLYWYEGVNPHITSITVK